MLGRRGAWTCTGGDSGGVLVVEFVSPGLPRDSSGGPPPVVVFEAVGPAGSGSASKGDDDSEPEDGVSFLSALPGGGAGAGAGAGSMGRTWRPPGDSSPWAGSVEDEAAPAGFVGGGVSGGTDRGVGLSSSNGDRLPPGTGGSWSGLGIAGPPGTGGGSPSAPGGGVPGSSIGVSVGSGSRGISAYDCAGLGASDDGHPQPGGNRRQHVGKYPKYWLR